MAVAAHSTRRPAEILTDDDAIALIRACSRRGSAGIRNAALIAVLWRAGLRLGEALDLKPRDLDLDHATLRVRHGKGDRSRTVGLDEQTIALVARWTDRRAKLGINGRAALFSTLNGTRLDQSYVRHALSRLREKAGLERRAHAHGLRHSFAAGLAREGVPMNVIRDSLGHSSLSTTDRYLRDIAPQHVIDTMRRRDWAAD